MSVSKPVNKDLIGSLIFLALSIAYGASAQLIPFYPGDEYEPFTARTLPFALSVLGAGLSFALLISAMKKISAIKKSSEVKLDQPVLKSALGYDWSTVIKLLSLMVFYALALKWLGFIIATTVFLFGGYWILGERRKKVLFGASLPFVVAFWFMLTQLLDIYLAPGQLFSAFGG